MNDDLNKNSSPGLTPELRAILINSLFGTIGVMWAIGGIAAILALYDVHWILGWISAFIWVWGCWAAALYFDVRKYFR
jgi:hypothetical protein